MESKRTDARLAGGVLLVGGAIWIMGVITAEAVYPGYSVRQFISDLGSTAPPHPVIHPAAAILFDGSTIALGVLLLVAAYFVRRAIGHRRLTVPLVAVGIGLVGVGIVSQGVSYPVHRILALIVFLGGTLAAVFSSFVAGRPFRYIGLALAVVTLLALVAFLVGNTNPVPAIGTGGTERWIAYPLMIWLVAFGGYLLGGGADAAADPSGAARP